MNRAMRVLDQRDAAAGSRRGMTPSGRYLARIEFDDDEHRHGRIGNAGQVDEIHQRGEVERR